MLNRYIIVGVIFLKVNSNASPTLPERLVLSLYLSNHFLVDVSCVLCFSFAHRHCDRVGSGAVEMLIPNKHGVQKKAS